MKERKISILRCKLNMHSTLNHSTSRTFVSWNMVMVLTFLVDQWNMKRISCDPRGAGHRTVTGEEGRCTLDVSPGGKPSCSWHIRITNYPARIRNLSPLSLFLKKNEVSGGKLFKFSADSYPYLKARMLVFIVFLHACQYISKTSS
uniref:Uncharacterized protein n=1 Tax=Populus trichocarpa TaxID=3694 RepID=A0A3N7EN04_POPTR